MIDLHLHFEGSIPEDDLIHLAKIQGIELPENFPDCVHADGDKPYYEFNKFALSLLTNKNHIEYAAYSVVRKLYELGYYYVELRFTPTLHTNDDMSQKDVLNAFLKGLYRGLDENEGLDMKVVLCCKKDNDFKVNKETIELAMDYHKDNIIEAVDFVGKSDDFNLDQYEKLIKKARFEGVKLLYHANKDVKSEEVCKAIELGAKRISGGFNVPLNNKWISSLLERGVCFEVLPSAAIQTKNVGSYEENIVKTLLFKGLPFAICSDNLTTSNTNVIKEFIHLNRHNDFHKNEVQNALLYAVNASLLEPVKRVELLQKINETMDWFYNQIM